MRHRTALVGSTAALLLAAASCARNPKPKLLGDTPALRPSFTIVGNPGEPPQLALELPRAAHINAFLVTPGAETRIIYPLDTTTAALLPPGAHQLRTFFGNRGAVLDTAPLLRRPGLPRGAGGGGMGDPSGGGGDSFATRRWILVYASDAPVPFGMLRQRIMGFTVPGYTDEALSTVARTIRSITPQGNWAAIALEFVPEG